MKNNDVACLTSDMNIVKITWVDAETIGDASWQQLDDVKDSIETEPPFMITVGFVLGSYDTHITLTDSLGTRECGHLTKIPRDMIKETSVLVRQQG